jgi:nicotinamide-nucleotide amidase
VVLTIGDELLVGDRLDSNARWLARALTEAAFEVVAIVSVGDDEARIGAALDEAAARAPGGLVVLTGGLGPTLDDRTREAVAAWLDRPLDEDAGVLEVLTARYRERGLAELPVLNRRLAQVPRGARVLPNPVGSAPGLEIEGPGAGDPLFLLLPGVPAEMEGLFLGPVAPRLDVRFPERPAPPSARVMRTSGLAESVLAEGLERVLDPALGVVLQYRPSLVGVELRFTAEGPGADLRLARALEAVEAEVAPWRYGGADDSLASAALDACAARGWKLGTAESCTGGLVGAWLTEIPGSSAVYAGGVVAYANALKTTLLDVSPQLLEMHGAVSEPVARAMAEGALQATDADLSVSITGVAGPGGGTASRPVGTVCFATARRGGETRSEGARFPGDREAVRIRAASHALRLVRARAVEGAGTA